MEEMHEENAQDKETLQHKLADLKKQLQKVNDEYLGKKIEYGREIALSKQQVTLFKQPL